MKLQSDDVLLQVQWSSWDTKKEEIRSRIKVEMFTALRKQKPHFENEMIKRLISEVDNYLTLREIINQLYESFGAMLHKVTGGCIELWISNESRQQLERMKTKKAEIEILLNTMFRFSTVNVPLAEQVQCSVTFFDNWREQLMAQEQVDDWNYSR